LSKKFDQVVEHIKSSGQGELAQGLREWEVLGGLCLKKCYELSEEIKERAEEETRLKILYTDTSNLSQEGLFDGFARSVYALALSPSEGWDYERANPDSDPSVLRLKEKGWPSREWHLAWLSLEHFDRLKDTHKRLVKEYRKSPVAKDIGKLVDEIATLNEELSKGLMAFSKEEIIPGNCRECPL